MLSAADHSDQLYGAFQYRSSNIGRGFSIRTDYGVRYAIVREGTVKENEWRNVQFWLD